MGCGPDIGHLALGCVVHCLAMSIDQPDSAWFFVINVYADTDGRETSKHAIN